MWLLNLLIQLVKSKLRNVANESLPPYEEHHQLLVEKVIKMLETTPECFTARWFNNDSMGCSVRSKNKSILIMIRTGQIIAPVEPIMTTEQKNSIKKLLHPIVKKDSDFLIEQLACGCE